MASSIGAASSKQRSYSLPPETGTTTTGAYPAWANLTNYVIDQTSGGINTVLNGGNIYQCITSGLSVNVGGGPSGTGTNITDGTAHWTFIGTANSNDTVAGSLILGIGARGTQSTIPGGAGNIPNTDNDSGGTYTTISNTAYNGFPDSFAGIHRRATAANNKSGFTVSAQFGGTSVGSGAGDEQTSMFVELRGVLVGAPHASSTVERATATAGICTAASITTTVPCRIISIWYGNGNVLTAGQSHVAVPQSGLVLVPGCVRLVSLTTSGYIQIAVATREQLTPGTFTESWSTGTGASEGAQLKTLAFALDTVTGTVAVTMDDIVAAITGNVEVSGVSSFVMDPITPAITGTVGGGVMGGGPSAIGPTVGSRIGPSVGHRVG